MTILVVPLLVLLLSNTVLLVDGRVITAHSDRRKEEETSSSRWWWWWWYQLGKKNGATTATTVPDNRTVVSSSALDTLWENLESHVRSRVDDAEQTLQEVHRRLEEAANEFQLQRDLLSREVISTRLQETLQQLHRQMEETARNLESSLSEQMVWETIGGDRIQEELLVLKQTAQQMEQGLESQLESVKRTVKRELLRQREGWNRWSRSIRNHLGLIVGTLCTFTGGLSPVARRRAVALQAGQLTWMTTNHYLSSLMGGNITTTTKTTRTPFRKKKNQDQNGGRDQVSLLSKLMSSSSVKDKQHSWIQDTAFLAVTGLLWRNNALLPLNSRPTYFLELFLPVFTVGYAFSRSARRIIDILKEQQQKEQLKLDVSPLQAAVVKTASAIVGVSLVTLVLPIPTAVVAASLAGTKLMVDSVMDEVVGNWFDMLQRIGPERLSSRLYNAVYRKFQREFLYPVRDAFTELEVVFSAFSSTTEDEERRPSNHNNKRVNTDNKDKDANDDASLRNKVKSAVSRCFRLRLHWTITSLGVLVQMELLRGIFLPPLVKGYNAVQEKLYTSTSTRIPQ
jgi:hypothetical protein